ncbi:hypothetical protein [Actinoalloteichus hymeniacidonis]|uniref:Uncharacterized protein n=1 Tax=Actinoalloteichus hymeniacidonis TaxID=340345 RepID=A0AAC9HSU0_9PSEU|nr:hypothetical protein [Actinoalloteichus hymeniacidonis]AOS63830.1 hypothetical protein TL08_15105 [Actinoalloteichus hymeniacidonis]MBB5908115.1 hypothetical protein [Actinoalloteichus hymeniacidonis]
MTGELAVEDGGIADRDVWFAQDTQSECGSRRDRHLVAGFRPEPGTLVVSLCCRSLVAGRPPATEDHCIASPGFRLCWDCGEVAAGRRPPPPTIRELGPVRLVRLRSDLVIEPRRLVHVSPPPDPAPALLRTRCGKELRIADLDILDGPGEESGMPCGVCLAASLIVSGADAMVGTSVSRRLGEPAVDADGLAFARSERWQGGSGYLGGRRVRRRAGRSVRGPVTMPADCCRPHTPRGRPTRWRGRGGYGLDEWW